MHGGFSRQNPFSTNPASIRGGAEIFGMRCVFIFYEFRFVQTFGWGARVPKQVVWGLWNFFSFRVFEVVSGGCWGMRSDTLCFKGAQ